jgi:hypothetical protein
MKRYTALKMEFDSKVVENNLPNVFNCEFDIMYVTHMIYQSS